MSEKDIAFKMIRTNIIHKRVTEGYLSQLGVYQGQHRMLMHLAKHEFKSQKELADEMKVSTATIAIGLKKLEKCGYIIRENDSKDGRLNKTVITDKGQKVVNDSVKICDMINKKMFEGFSRQDFELYEKYLSIIENNLLKLEEENRNK